MSNPPHKDDRASWYVTGARMESRLIGAPLKSCVLVRNPGKLESPYVHDCFAMFPADIKSRRTPFISADRYGVSPKTAVTLNVADVNAAAAFPFFVFIFDIAYPDFASVRFCTLAQVDAWAKSCRARVHQYQDRDGSDGNKTTSYVLDALWMREL